MIVGLHLTFPEMYLRRKIRIKGKGDKIRNR
jgi:hypothetical protein